MVMFRYVRWSTMLEQPKGEQLFEHAGSSPSVRLQLTYTDENSS